MAHAVRILPAALRALERLPPKDQRRLRRRIDALAEEPRPDGCRKLAGGDAEWRIRVGDYRVIYRVQDAELIVLVIRVAHRREVYRPRR